MEKYSQIVEEEEEDAYQEEEEELYEEDKEESEDDELQFIQEPMRLHQFLNEDHSLQEETDNLPYINCVEDYDQNEFQVYQNAKSPDKQLKNFQTNTNPIQIHRQKSLKPINSTNEDNTKTYKSQFAKQSSANSINITKTTQISQNANISNINTDEVGFKRPKTANNIQINTKLIPEKQFQQPKYIINKMNVPKETYYAYRSLSPTKNDSKEKSSQLNITSPQFLFTAIQNNSSLQLQKLAQIGLLDASSIQQIDDQKQNILEIDQKVLFLNNTGKKIKQQNQNNFYKKDNNINNSIISNFQTKFTTSKISHHAKFKTERSSSHSPSKQIKKQSLPHRLIQVVQLQDRLNPLNNLVDKDKNQQKQQSFEIEKSASPASKIEEKYMKAMKSIEKAYQLHELAPKKNDISFNNQYFTIIRYTQQLKTPIEILDQDFIHCSMYALSYNAYFIPITKRQFPYIFELVLENGEVEAYVSKSENPNIENNDFLFVNFDIPIKINYQKNEIKEGIFLNIFCRKQSTFRFRVVSESNSVKMINGISTVNRVSLNKNESKRKNYYTMEYKNQLIMEKASHNEQKLKFEKNMNFFVVEQSVEDQNKEDNFLKVRFKNKTCKNIIEQNKEGVRKYSPNERKEHLNKLKEEKQVKIVKAQYIKNLQKYQELSKGILNIQRKAERKEQLIDADGRLESEVRLLKQCFQYRWLQLFVLIQIVKVFSYFIKAYKVKEARNLNQTNPMISLNRLMNGYLCRKLGKTKDERTFSRVYYCLKTRVKAFKKLMKHNSQLVAGEYMKQKIKIMIIQSKMMVYYKHIVTIQRSYRNLLRIRDVMNEVNIKHWDITIKSMLEDESKFFDKSWIAKPILVDYKRRIEKNKVKTLAHFVKGVQSQYFSKLKQYQTKLRKLPYSYQIAYQFCGKAFKTYFEKQYAKQINEGFQMSIKKTTEYLIEALKFMVKHNIYQIVNNPIIAYEKEKQKQLEAQKKKNIESLRQKEIQLQKQREEEYLLQKMQRNPKKSTLIQNQDNESGQSSSSQESIEEGQKHDQSMKKDNKLKLKKHCNQIEQSPLSFQDYLQIEEKKIEENNARRVSKIKLTTQFSKGDAQSPIKNLELVSSGKKQLHLINKIASSSLNVVNAEEIGSAEEVDFTPRHGQANQKNHLAKPFAKNHDDINSQRLSGFKKERLNSLHKQDQIHHITQNVEKKNSILKKHNKKQVKKIQDIEQKEENDNEDVEEEDEYEENENSNDEGDNTSYNKSTIKRHNQKKQSINSQNLNSKEEEDDEEQNSKLVFELTGQQQATSFKRTETKQQSYKGVLKSNLSSSGSQQSIQSQSQISNSNVSSSSNLNTQNNLSLTKQQISQAELQSSQFYLSKDQQNSSLLQSGLAANRPNKNQKQKKKKQKKKRVETKEENKLEEIKEGDEAIQTFWANFIHYPIFTSFPNITEMKELIIKLLKKL
ncbi:hypothetical protein TTHERM_00268100 (macronuclear) [Tetrahymena thermophila SB210]|uniref:Uncharacterized protein n=1 Tax=Tetrahymena thermophila (strain SB210) TaxID=312017 RepID=I7LUQ6_TETTS|nr:hypothetical protein TTHERM_00268100 [Tetrahymena thermophila SB210]EAR95700.2 hypothetical protein TTHERM_00268100 [Tetrahymena thermophila SB210]|eukprot:XP_001015945.2 hypothetical protein TTHERM_00268100 [Tetrahymena thermophila SB210]